MSRRHLRGATRAASSRAAGTKLAAVAAYHVSADLASRRFGVPIEQIEARKGRLFHTPPRSVAVARRSAIYLAVVAFDRSLRSVARAARFTPEGARRALHAIEDLRDDPAFDRQIEAMVQELIP